MILCICILVPIGHCLSIVAAENEEKLQVTRNAESLCSERCVALILTSPKLAGISKWHMAYHEV